MTRFTLSRSEIRAEVERRKAGVTPAQPVVAMPPTAAPRAPGRWSAKVFVVPAAVADALAKLSRTVHGIVDEAQVGARHSMRRHRGVYIWRPAMDQHGEPDRSDELAAVQDVKTAETEIERLRQKPLH